MKELAKKFNVKCFETSTGNYHLETKEIFYKLLVGINHNIDELLVELTLQMKQKRLERFKRRRSSIRMVSYNESSREEQMTLETCTSLF